MEAEDAEGGAGGDKRVAQTAFAVAEVEEEEEETGDNKLNAQILNVTDSSVLS